MKFILIFGPPAVGKMTVGQELEKITGYKLLHDHMTIDLITHFFSVGTREYYELNNIFRFEIFKRIANSNLKGLIFTHPWAIEEKFSTEFIDNTVKIFEKENIDVFYVELEAKIEERIKRNRSANRLACKPSKRDIVSSEVRLIEYDKKFRFNTKDHEFTRKNYLKIDNTTLSAREAASQIVKSFNF